MRRTWGAVSIAVALALLLAGCADGGSTEFKDSVAVVGVPACRTWPIELAGDTYWEMTPGQVGEWKATHKIPDADAQGAAGFEARSVAAADVPQVHASAAWTDLDDGVGTLYRYEDGTALFIARTGNQIYFTDVEREFDAVC